MQDISDKNCGKSEHGNCRTSPNWRGMPEDASERSNVQEDHQ
jgi:hypothetical protein